MTQRKYKRFKITAISKLDNTSCSVINVSKEGMMVCGDWRSPQTQVDIQLKIRNQWLEMKGRIVWCMASDIPKLKRIGIFINMAPPEYGEFIDNLYIEADEKKN